MKLLTLFIFLKAFQLPQDDRSVLELVEKLRSDRIEEREIAEHKLQQLGSKALPALERATRNPDTEMAQRARDVIRTISVIQKLTPTLFKTIPGIAKRLSSDDDHTWTALFLEAIEEENGKRRYPTLAEPDLLALLEPAVKGSRDQYERIRICEAAGQLRLRGAEIAIAGMTRDQVPGVQQAAIRALGKLDTKESVAALIAVIRSKAGLRDEAVRALGKLTVEDVAPILVEAAFDHEPLVASAGFECAVRLGKRDLFLRKASLSLASEDAQNRARGVFILGELKATKSVSDVAKLLSDPAVTVRQSAIVSLHKLDAKEFAGAIAQLAGREIESLAKVAVECLVEWKPPGVVSELMKVTTDRSNRNRRWMIWAIAELNSTDRIDELAVLLEDEDPTVRSGALWALAKLRAKSNLTAAGPFFTSRPSGPSEERGHPRCCAPRMK